MPLKYRRILESVNQTVWAIRPEKLEAIAAFLELKAVGGVVSDEDVRAIASERAIREPETSGGVAVIPVLGVLGQRMDMMLATSGGTSTDRIARTFDAAMADDDVGSIVLDFDSSGGSVFGLEELATKIYQARGQGKRIVSIANSEAASAAYYIATAPDEVVVTPGGWVGSVGTLAVHLDASAADESEGRKYTIIKRGEFKAEGNSYEPLGDEARAQIQREVDHYYGMFVAAVARHRGVSEKTVQSDFGQGRMVTAKEAVARGMADRVATLEEVIAGLLPSQSSEFDSPRSLATRRIIRKSLDKQVE